MKRILALSLLPLLCALWLPLLFLRGGGEAAEAPSPVPAAETPSPAPSPPPAPTPPPPVTPGAADSETRFTALVGNAAETVTMADYLPGVLAGEMPASFEFEALKAQAVAARSYILYHMAHPPAAHPDCAVCGDSTCCKAWLSEAEMREKWGDDYDQNREKIDRAAAETDGEYLVWEGQAIQAVFHAASGGRTESSANVWSALPYLVSVDTPETAADVPDFITAVEAAPADFRAAILDVSPDAALDGDAAGWLGPGAWTETGRVSAWQIGGVMVPGTALRSLFSLRSTAFTLEYTGSAFLFTVTGYGHGVGMSQYGANVLAQNGLDYREILAHYYPGTQLFS